MKKIIYILLFLIFVWFVGFVQFNYKINNVEIDEDIKTDAIVALTGGRNRISKAIKLLNNDMAEKLLISGVYEGTSIEELKERNGVEITSIGGITLDKKSQNTVENAIETMTWIEANNIKSIRLVTSNYHIPRSMVEFRGHNRDLIIVPHPVFSDRIPKEWWRTWRSFRLLGMEYNKFLYVWIRDFLTPEREKE